MTRTIFTLILIWAIARWLKTELKTRASLSKYWGWLAAGAVFQIGAEVISTNMSNLFLGNILLHTIGGGIAGTCFFFYLTKSFKITVNWRLQLSMLFLFVSGLGVLNELWEFSFELLHFGKYSFDTHDTWRDLASNTGGALLAWTLIRGTRHLKLDETFAAKVRDVHGGGTGGAKH